MAVLCVNAGPVNGTADFTVSLTELGISSSKGAVVRVRDAIESIFILYVYTPWICIYSHGVYISFFKKKTNTLEDTDGRCAPLQRFSRVGRKRFLYLIDFKYLLTTVCVY